MLHFLIELDTKWQLAISLLLIAYISGLFLAIMPIDAAQYASISREMLETGDFLSVKHQYANYLDKPPLLFWLSALSFSLLGVTGFAYHLPSVLAAFLGIFATYRLAKLLYDPATALIAASILASTQAYFLFCHDIRTDTLLTAFVITAIWLLRAWFDNTRHWLYALGGFTAIALAMLSKGPIGAVVPAFALGCYLLAHRQWQLLVNPVWLLGAFWVLCLLSPMLYGLYMQYGEHGIRFYFWEQSFGRVTGSSKWHNKTDPLFFIHTFLWSFLPYSLLALAAFFVKLKNILIAAMLLFNKQYSTPQNNNHNKSSLTSNLASDALVVGGFLLTFIGLSFSQYKLPHYIFVVFPLAAIFTANLLANGYFKGRFWQITHHFIGFLICTIALLLVFWAFSDETVLWQKIGVLLLCVTWLFIAAKLNTKLSKISENMDNNGSLIANKTTKGAIYNAMPAYFCAIFWAIVSFNLVLNGIFYPQLTQYESGYQAAKIYKRKQLQDNSFVAQNYGISNHAFDFYTQQSNKPITNTSDLRTILTKQNIAVYTDEAGLKDIIAAHITPQSIDTLPHFAVTRLNIKFLNPTRRNAQLNERFLLWLPLMDKAAYSISK